MKLAWNYSSLLLVSALASPAWAAPAVNETEVSADSEMGFVPLDKALSSMIEEGDLRFNFGGRIQFDMATTSSDRALKAAGFDSVEGTEFRRARFFASGTIYKMVKFKAEYDFAGGSAVMKDVYGELSTSVAKLRVGHFKEPFSLDELTSSRYGTFTERSGVTAFAAAHNSGVMAHNAIKGANVTWALGVFGNADSSGKTAPDASYNITGRATWAPLHNPERGEVVHLGLAYSHRGDQSGSIGFASRGSSHFTQKFADADATNSKGASIFGVEAAATLGPLSVQAEYAAAEVDAQANDFNFSAYYVAASYFLTGEHRPYKGGKFQRVKPNNVFGEAGNGAFEVAARYGMLDLTDGGLMGGELNNIALALNWYLNSHARIQVQASTTELDNSAALVSNESGTSEALAIRFYMDW